MIYYVNHDEVNDLLAEQPLRVIAHPALFQLTNALRSERET